MSVADEVRKALESDSRTLAEIAKLSGVHPVNLRQFKAGSRGLSLQSLEEVAKAIGYKLSLKKHTK